MNYPNHLINSSHFKYNYCYSKDEEENTLAKGDKDEGNAMMLANQTSQI
jgi:hypothetical protein